MQGWIQPLHSLLYWRLPFSPRKNAHFRRHFLLRLISRPALGASSAGQDCPGAGTRISPSQGQLCALILCIGVLKIAMPGLKKHLASWSHRRYNTPTPNMKKSPSNQATAVLLYLVKKGSLTTCKTTDSVGVHGNSGNKSIKK